MLRLINIFWFLIYKGGEAAGAYYLFRLFNLRHDILVYGFYGFLSLFQLAFFLSQTLPARPVSGASAGLLRHSSLLSLLLSLLVNSATTYYMYLQENDPANLMFIVAALTLWGIFYLTVHKLLLGGLLRDRRLEFSRLTVMPRVVQLLVGIGVPLGYIFFKTLVLKKETTVYDEYLVLAVIVIHAFSWLILGWKDVVRARAVLKPAAQDRHPVCDDDVVGLLQGTRAAQPLRSAPQAGPGLARFSDYLSVNIRQQLQAASLNYAGETKNATVLTLQYAIDYTAFTPETALAIEQKIVRLAGEYADEYDAYPLFSPNRISLVFGVPFFFEHQRYHALESCIKIMTDIEDFAEQEGVSVRVHAGLFSGSVMAGNLPLFGKTSNVYGVVGEAVVQSQQIAEVAARIDKKMLCDNETVEGLRTKFFVEKVYKIKLASQAEQLVNQIKV